MDEIEEALKVAKDQNRNEHVFINQEQAKDFMGSCGDPVVREILWKAYATLTFRMAPRGPQGAFDVFYFIQIVDEMLKDRQEMLRVLSGEPEDEE